MSLNFFLRSSVVCGVTISVAISLSQGGERPSDDKEQKLTPERAKEALLEMMRSKAGEDLGWFEGEIPDKLAKQPIEEEKDGWYAWTGAFRFNTSKAVYKLVIRPK